jgi:transposase-like protein
MDATPKTLQEAIQRFGDEQVCIDTVAKMRWPDGPVCPACGHKEHYYLKTQKRWKCKECYKQFTVKLGTIFEDSPLGLDKWLCGMWLIANAKNGISSWEVHRALGISQKAAWFMLHRLRYALQTKSLAKMGGNGGECEADETYVGGSMRNMHKSKRLARFGYKRGAVGKAVVMGILDRSQKKVHAKVLRAPSIPLLQGEIRDKVEAGTKLYTDEAQAYTGMANEYAHQVVRHIEQYVDGRVHTNGLENFWSLLKRGLNGTYVCVEPFHLFRYVDEQVFRFNNRATRDNPMTDADRFNLALSQIAGKRLTFAEVTGKTAEENF